MRPVMHPLDKEEEALRRAVSRNDFRTAALSARRYARLVAAGLPDLSPADREARLRRACSLLDWGRRNLLATRTRLAQKVNRLQGVSRYHAAIPVPPTPVHTWTIQA